MQVTCLLLWLLGTVLLPLLTQRRRPTALLGASQGLLQLLQGLLLTGLLLQPLRGL